jgi:hypothetical protein
MLSIRGAHRAGLLRGVLASVFLGAVAAGAIFACGQGAVGVDACLQIERARCGWVVACNIPLPVRRNDSDASSPVDDCNRYYEDQCLHGLSTTYDPDKGQVGACVDAINAATDCTIVNSPESADACAFLVPIDAGSDADGD